MITVVLSAAIATCINIPTVIITTGIIVIMVIIIAFQVALQFLSDRPLKVQLLPSSTIISLPCAWEKVLLWAYLTPYTSHLTPHTSHPTPHTSHITPHTSHLTPHTSHITPHSPPQHSAGGSHVATRPDSRGRAVAGQMFAANPHVLVKFRCMLCIAMSFLYVRNALLIFIAYYVYQLSICMYILYTIVHMHIIYT